jgi:TPR repeat protein
MKEKRNLHLKVQEMCDCYATGDPLKEMSIVKNDEDKDEAALKWLALAALHGVNNNAEEITITRSSEGNVRILAEYRESELPSPGPDVGGKILNALREITHIEKDKGKTPLSLGIRNDSVNLMIKFKEKNGKEKITIKFPE